MLAGLLLACAPVCPRAVQALPEVLQYDLRLVVDPESREIRGEATVEVSARRGTLEELHFALNNTFRIDEVREGQRQVKPIAGKRIAEGKQWTVKLVPPLAPGQKRQVHVDYHGKGVDPGPQDSDWMGIVLVREDEIRMSHQAQWYPILPLDDRARSKLAAPTTLELVLPAGLRSLGPGELESQRRKKAVETHRWVSDSPVRPSILAGRYEEQVVKAGGQRVRALCFEGHERGAKRWAQEAARVLEELGEVYGDPGKRTYGLAEMRVRNRGKSYNYEADGFSVYDGVLFDGRAPDARKIAHEVAHLYFGGAVDPGGTGERFLVESLAEAAAFVYLERAEGDASAVEAAMQASRRYFQGAGEELEVVRTDFASPRYVPVIYGKGALALRTLRAWAGPEAFDAVLRDYVEACRAGELQPTLGTFLGALRAEFGERVDSWEDDWLRRPGCPRYRLETESAPAGGKRTRVSGNLIQEGSLYHNPVELGMISRSGKRTIIQVTPRMDKMRFEAVVPHDVERVEVDPRYLLLAERD